MFSSRNRPGLLAGVVAFTILACVPGDLRAQDVAPGRAEEEVRAAAGAFVQAFNDLEWDAFEASWAEDATAFFPIPGLDQRIEGRDAVVGAFKGLFGDFPESRPGPPYLSIDPLDVQVWTSGRTGIVTFHLGDAPPYNRRTLVFEKYEDRWLIVHLHASDPSVD